MIKDFLDSVKSNHFSFSKGLFHDKEEFSFLENDENRRTFISLLKYRKIHDVVVCGEALDFCVLATILDLVEFPQIERVFLCPI